MHLFIESFDTDLLNCFNWCEIGFLQNILNTKYSLSYKDESKVLQYFGNMRYNLTLPDALVEVVKVTDHTEL